MSKAKGTTRCRGAMLYCLLAFFLVAAVPAVSASSDTNQTAVILVVGAPGLAEYGSNFVHQAALWRETCEHARARVIQVGLTRGGTNDLERLKEILDAEPADGAAALWLVLIGHGTFDGREARFNLNGPDLSASELAAWLRPYTRPVVVIDTASSSAPFLNALAATNRVVITATRSGHEQNFARFGSFFAEALEDPVSDLDMDDQVSLLEAFLTASSRVEEWYKTEGRLATEHALLDDNGDGKGTPADWFRGARAIKKPTAGETMDGRRAHQIHLVMSPDELKLSPETRARRDALELDVARLRDRKTELGEDDYYVELEKLLLELARLYPTNQLSP